VAESAMSPGAPPAEMSPGPSRGLGRGRSRGRE